MKSLCISILIFKHSPLNRKALTSLIPIQVGKYTIFGYCFGTGYYQSEVGHPFSLLVLGAKGILFYLCQRTEKSSVRKTQLLRIHDNK